jgi:hypothetical protein
MWAKEWATVWIDACSHDHWLIVIYEFTSRSRIFHLYGDTTAGEGLQNLGLCSALTAVEQGGIFIVPHLLWHGDSVFPVSTEGPPHLRHTRGVSQRFFTILRVLAICEKVWWAPTDFLANFKKMCDCKKVWTNTWDDFLQLRVSVWVPPCLQFARKRGKSPPL